MRVGLRNKARHHRRRHGKLVTFNELREMPELDLEIAMEHDSDDTKVSRLKRSLTSYRIIGNKPSAPLRNLKNSLLASHWKFRRTKAQLNAMYHIMRVAPDSFKFAYRRYNDIKDLAHPIEIIKNKVCRERKKRREVLFAKRKTGKGGHRKRPNYNFLSLIRCA